MLEKEIAAELATHEIEWWKAHHRREEQKLFEEMCRLYMLQFCLEETVAQEIVRLRVEATAFHDEAERLEDLGLQKQADVYWGLAHAKLKTHFDLLCQLGEMISVADDKQDVKKNSI